MAGSGKLHPVAAFVLYGALGLVIIGFMIVSGVANVTVWWESASGWVRYVFASIGIGAEVWGAFGLVLMTRRFAQGQWLKGAVAALLWFPAVGFNGYSSYRFFTLEGAEVQGVATVEKTALDLAETRISELTTELAAIGEVRAADAVRAERDVLPEAYKTRRAELSAELGQAVRKEQLESDLAAARADKLAYAAAGNQPDGKALTDCHIIAALVIWMECVKALALWVISGRAEAPTGARRRKSEDEAQETETLAPEPPEHDNVHILTTADGRQVRVL